MVKLAALCWTMIKGGLLCSLPYPVADIQTVYQVATANMDYAQATQVVIVYDNSPQWKTVKTQHPNYIGYGTGQP